MSDARMITAVAAMFAAGCQSARETEQHVAVIGTVATMVALAPLVPVVEGVRELSGQPERRRAKFEAVRARLDPIAERRIAAVAARDPVEDALTLHRDGVVAFLPVAPGRQGNYPGLFGPEYDLQKLNLYVEAARASPLFQELETLLNPVPDELVPHDDEPRYSSPAANRYREMTGRYKVAFNRKMYRLAQIDRLTMQPVSAGTSADAPTLDQESP